MKPNMAFGFTTEEYDTFLSFVKNNNILIENLEYGNLKTTELAYRKMYVQGYCPSKEDLSLLKLKYPDIMNIESYVDLGRTSIKELPDNLIIKNSLYMSASVVDVLPNNLRVKECLYLNDSYISTIPDDLQVYQNIIVDNLQAELISILKNSRFSDILYVTQDAYRTSKRIFV